MPSLTTIALLALAATTQALPLQPSSTSLHTKRLSLPIWPWEIPGSKPAGVKKIIAFGDSLSDNGNTFRILNNTYPYTSRYFGGRYSNGRTWVEYLSETLKVPLEDYAYGGSSTDDIVVKGEAPSGTVVENMPGMVQQVEDWRKTAPTFDAATTLFTVWSGANGMFLAISVCCLSASSKFFRTLRLLQRQIRHPTRTNRRRHHEIRQLPNSRRGQKHRRIQHAARPKRHPLHRTQPPPRPRTPQIQRRKPFHKARLDGHDN